VVRFRSSCGKDGGGKSRGAAGGYQWGGNGLPDQAGPAVASLTRRWGKRRGGKTGHINAPTKREFIGEGSNRTKKRIADPGGKRRRRAGGEAPNARNATSPTFVYNRGALSLFWVSHFSPENLHVLGNIPKTSHLPFGGSVCLRGHRCRVLFTFWADSPPPLSRGDADPKPVRHFQGGIAGGCNAV